MRSVFHNYKDDELYVCSDMPTINIDTCYPLKARTAIKNDSSRRRLGVIFPSNALRSSDCLAFCSFRQCAIQGNLISAHILLILEKYDMIYRTIICINET